MSDESDEKKRLGKKARHITWVDRIKAGFRPPEERAQYIEDTANRKEDEERRAKSRRKGPGI